MKPCTSQLTVRFAVKVRRRATRYGSSARAEVSPFRRAALATGADMLIPADYAGKNIHLGYAATIHRSQGATVDVTHAVIDTSVDRAGLYVAMTRGRRENRVYAVCEPVLDLGAEDGHRRDPAKVTRLVGKLLAKDRPVLLCTHRPVLPTVLDALAAHASGGVAAALPHHDPYLGPGEVLVAHVARGTGRVVAVERHPLPAS